MLIYEIDSNKAEAVLDLIYDLLIDIYLDTNEEGDDDNGN